MQISKLTIITLLLITMTTMMSNVAIVTTLPHLKDYFTDEPNIEFLSRLMITLPSLAIAILAPILGHLVFKFGKKRSAFLALFFFGLFGSAGLYLDTMNELLASRFLLGITIAVLMIVSTSLVGDYFHGEARHKFMGTQSAFIAIGGVLFVLGGGLLSDINWRYAFGIYTIGFFLIPFVLKYLLEVKKNSFVDDDTPIDANLFGVYFLAFLLMVIFYILPTQIPFLIMNHFGTSSTFAGSVIALAFVSNALGALSFAKLKKKYSFATMYIIGMSIIALGFIAIGLITNRYMFFFTSPIMGFGGGILMTTISAWMLHLAHHTRRVKASGYLTSSLFLGQFFSPIVFHPFVDYFGVQHFFIVIGCFIFLAVLSTIVKRKYF